MAHNTDFTYIYDPTSPDTGGLDFREVAQALGETTLDCGRLCTSDNINMWAKYKPVRFKNSNGLFFGRLTDAQRAQVNWGISTPGINYAAFFDTDDRHWLYLKPRGNDYQEAYRILDFDGYRNNKTGPDGRIVTGSGPLYDKWWYNKANSMDFQGFYDAEEISVLDMKLEPAPGVTPISIQQFNIMFLLKYDGKYYVHNTGMKLGQIAGSLPHAIIPVGFLAAVIGTSCDVATVLCSDPQIPVPVQDDVWTAEQQGQQLTTFYMYPLSFDHNMKAEKTLTVDRFEIFTNASTTESMTKVTHAPSTGDNNWRFLAAFVCKEVNDGDPEHDSYPIYLTVRAMRGTQVVATRQIYSQSTSTHRDPGTKLWIFEINGGQEISTSAFAQLLSGDKLYIDFKYDGETFLSQLVYTI